MQNKMKKHEPSPECALYCISLTCLGIGSTPVLLYHPGPDYLCRLKLRDPKDLNAKPHHT